MEHSLEFRGVRFDDECILIPDPQPRSRMPRLLINPFAFKRRHSQDSYSPTSYHSDAPPSPTGTFPRPALSRKYSLTESPPLSPPPVYRHASLPPTPTTSARPRAPSLSPLQRDRVNLYLFAHVALIASLRPSVRLCWAKNGQKSSLVQHATIQWSSNITEDSTPAAFHPILVVDEADHKASLVTKPSPAPDGEQELTDALHAIDRLSVQEPEDGILPPLLTRQKPWLSPIPSNNASIDDVSREPSTVAAEDPPLYLPVQVSPPPSPLPKTPPSLYSSPVASPKISSPSPSERGSPRIGSSFRIPKGASLMRAGADILRGVSVIGTSPV
ncbi:hypothetical protein EDB85DRAFT_2138544 [Lactarius pseudohatsudake]|nr:hypothetical protein EDB85DRAFT_2138544 [Lactarius pseudohatsudake]